MDAILDILEDLKPGEDYRSRTDLVDARVLDSLTILAGSDMDDAAFEELLAAIEEAQPDLEIDAHRGEQPLYPVIFSIE